MPIIKNIYRFLQASAQPVFLYKYVIRQKKFIKNNITPLLIEAQASADGSLDENDLKKITGYYGLAVPAVLGQAFCKLFGTGMTDKERLAGTCQGAMTGLGDDFFDKQRLSPKAVKDFIENPGQFYGNTAGEKLFLHFYKTALASVPGSTEMQKQIYRVFHAQMLSKQQDADGIPNEALRDITIQKGAESLLFYRTAFENPLNPEEKKMLYCLGGLMQLSNDIFDVYKDYKSGVTTLATSSTNINNLQTYYWAQLQTSVEAAYKTKYPKTHIRKFLGFLSIGIFSRTLVCLKQLQKIEKKSGGNFNISQYSRKELICDMDTIQNKLASLRYHLNFCRRLR